MARGSKFKWSVSTEDVKAVQTLVQSDVSEFLEDRRTRNITGHPPDFSKERFWHTLLVCLFTTQQRATKGSPVNRFLESDPFPLSLESCKRRGSARKLVLQTINDAGRIRRGNTIAKQAAPNLKQLDRGLWRDVERWFAVLREQRAREPNPSSKFVEREAARWADKALAGLGPKQSRNLWQILGLTRFEIPIDSRVVRWANAALSTRLEEKRLGNVKYYESALDYLQEICLRSGVLPCELDGAAFDFENRNSPGSVRRTTDPGFVNRHAQVTIRNTGAPGTDHNQFIYQLACSRCGHVYAAYGSDIHERKCPTCQGGRPGIPVARV